MYRPGDPKIKAHTKFMKEHEKSHPRWAAGNGLETYLWDGKVIKEYEKPLEKDGKYYLTEIFENGKWEPFYGSAYLMEGEPITYDEAMKITGEKDID